MSISRNDFEAIAHGFRQHLEDTQDAIKAGRSSAEHGRITQAAIRDCAARMAKVMKARNSGFQPDRFLNSCEPRKEEG